MHTVDLIRSDTLNILQLITVDFLFLFFHTAFLYLSSINHTSAELESVNTIILDCKGYLASWLSVLKQIVITNMTFYSALLAWMQTC